MGASGLPATSAALDLTHVQYDPTSHVSLGLALLTLSPILLMASYAALAVQTREITIIFMWAGQLACEALNYVIKHKVKEARPHPELGDGYGFPSSHSQWMGYFATFLACHVAYRHVFTSSGSRVVDAAFRVIVYLGLYAWAGMVAYSRYYLKYHTSTQVLAGFSIGCIAGYLYYVLVELVPVRRPKSLAALLRAYIVANPVSTWLRIRDTWSIWPDAGQEASYQSWRKEWERTVIQRLRHVKQA